MNSRSSLALFLVLLLSTKGCQTAPAGLPFPPGVGPLDLNPSVADIQSAVWLLGALVEIDGEDRLLPIGTGFAVDQRHWATNAHVIDAIGFLLLLSDAVDVALEIVAVQHESGVRHALTSFWRHPAYLADDPSNLTTPDVGIIQSDVELTRWFRIADGQKLRGLAVFDSLSLCGFPGDVDFIFETALGSLRPRATCLTGSVTALRPFDPSVAATVENTLLVQHSIATSPGTSGSPIMNDVGEVVAINFAATTDQSATNRFAIRADAVMELLQLVSDGQPGLTPASLKLSINSDTDGDGVDDDDEVTIGTNPLLPDTDDDGLSDGEEVSLGTDPTLPDTDDDLLLDGLEVFLGFDPLTFNETGFVDEIHCSQFATVISSADGSRLAIERSTFSSLDFDDGFNIGDLVVFDSENIMLVIDTSSFDSVIATKVGAIIDSGTITDAYAVDISVGIDLSSASSYVFNSLDSDIWGDWHVGDAVIIARTTFEGTVLTFIINRDECEKSLLR